MEWNEIEWEELDYACAFHTVACASSPNCRKLSVVLFSSVAAECGEELPVRVFLPMTVLVQNLTWRS